MDAVVLPERPLTLRLAEVLHGAAPLAVPVWDGAPLWRLSQHRPPVLLSQRQHLSLLSLRRHLALLRRRQHLTFLSRYQHLALLSRHHRLAPLIHHLLSHQPYHLAT